MGMILPDPSDRLFGDPERAATLGASAAGGLHRENGLETLGGHRGGGCLSGGVEGDACGPG
jgi:hypothetical protein